MQGGEAREEGEGGIIAADSEVRAPLLVCPLAGATLASGGVQHGKAGISICPQLTGCDCH